MESGREHVSGNTTGAAHAPDGVSAAAAGDHERAAVQPTDSERRDAMSSAATDVGVGSNGATGAAEAGSAAAEQLLWAEPSRLKAPVVPTDLAYLSQREQVLLYAMVFGLAPRRVLEVGVMH